MSKKIIALVLFAAMLIALVPTASAVNYSGEYPLVKVMADGWYAGQNVEQAYDTTIVTTTDGTSKNTTGHVFAGIGKNSTTTTETTNTAASGLTAASTKTVATTYTAATGEFKTDVDYTGLGSRNLNGKMTAGLTVDVDEKKTALTGTYAGKVISQNINITGSYSELQPYYFSYLAQNGTMGFALKIPVRVGIYDGTKTVNVSNSAYISGAAGYMNTYANATTEVAYITVPLTAADQIFTYKIWYDNSQQYTLTINWKNTDNAANTTTTSTTVPNLTVIGVAGEQKDNFRADFTQAYWKKSGTSYYYYPGVLKFDIAAMTKADRAAILGAGSKTIDANEMTIKVKATDKNGYPYPQGTIVTFQGKTNQDMYLGSSDKFVTVTGTASYLIDSQSTFNMTFTGIKNFAYVAAVGNVDPNGLTYDFSGWYKGDYVDVGLNGYDAFASGKLSNGYKDDGNVYLYTLVSGSLEGSVASATTTSTSKVVTGSYVLRFAYGNTAEEVGFTLKYQNVTRSTSGITLLNDVVTVKVGEKVGIAWIVNDPMAMYQGVKEGWKVVNESIAKAADGDDATADNANTIMIEGKKVGTTYAFCTDYNKDVQLVIINVVAADYVAEPEVEVELGTKYVVTASKLNVREGASTSTAKIRQLKRNTVVMGTEVEGSVWVKLNDGGYVHGKYLAEVE